MKQIEDNLNPSNLVHTVVLLTREGSRAGSVNRRDILNIGMIPVWGGVKTKSLLTYFELTDRIVCLFSNSGRPVITGFETQVFDSDCWSFL